MKQDIKGLSMEKMNVLKTSVWQIIVDGLKLMIDHLY